jgi:hypothetical protein
MPKTAIVILSDPTPGSDEALGRLFNALFTVFGLKQRNEEVALVFQGAGTRWPAEVAKPDHPAHALFNAVSDKAAGVCGGCADVFGASAEVAKGALPLLRDLKIPGTSGVTDLSHYVASGYQLLMF